AGVTGGVRRSACSGGEDHRIDEEGAAMARGPDAVTDDTAAVVSVIIPVYDEERYVAACVRSVLDQSHRALQVIAVDDGSTDASPEILRRMAAADSRLTILTQTNAGVSAARNAGLDAVVGA